MDLFDQLTLEQIHSQMNTLAEMFQNIDKRVRNIENYILDTMNAEKVAKHILKK